MNLFCFGAGYSLRHFIDTRRTRFASVTGTARSQEGVDRLSRMGVAGRIFDGASADSRIADDVAAADALLVSIPPGDDGDPVLAAFGQEIAASPRLSWIGYLSTIGVYGDHAGGLVDEATPTEASSPRAAARIAAEREWLALGARAGKAVQIFRLAGIYGPGRGAVEQLRRGVARRIVKPGQVFNRIHVEDIARTLDASLARPCAGAIYNVCDDEPAPPQDVVAYAAELMGVPAPRETPFEEADMSPMARDFYASCKRASNARIREELGVDLAFPTYREGLAAIVAGG
ncbi:MAG: NAD-dependent epimerase/dehydratase family protein [Salinarimonadaceae bacterium]|nr:MAG: NAD-dependent epimerase/dehydratase family protein [Salinarimonadaceae bacterium]